MSSKNTSLFQNEIEKVPDRGSAAPDGGDDAAEKSNGRTARLHKTTGKATGRKKTSFFYPQNIFFSFFLRFFCFFNLHYLYFSLY